MDRFEAMAVFVAVADLKGFAPAARRLKLTPSSVTRLVAGLEERLEIRLLQRTTRSVTLTDAGARYLARARQIVADVGEAEGAAQAEHHEPTGRIVVTAPSTFGRIHVVPLMSAYLSRYPTVIGDLSLSDRIVNLVDDGVDVAVRIGQLEDSSLVARKIGETRRVVVASPKYLQKKKLRSPSDLKSHKVIQFSAMSPLPEWTFERAGHSQSLTFAPGFVTNSADAAIAHAEAGGGVTMQLAYQVKESVRAGRLKILLADFEPEPYPIHLVYSSARLIPAKLRAFLDLARESCDWHFVKL